MHFMQTSLIPAQCFKKDELNQALQQCLHDPGAVLQGVHHVSELSVHAHVSCSCGAAPPYALRGNGAAWTSLVVHIAARQSGPCAFTLAQDPFRLDEYLTANPFLPDINNEGPSKNATYADNLASLKRLVLYRFEDEYTVVPRGRHAFLIFNKINDLPPSTCSKPSAQPDGGWIGHIWCYI